jgi:hypothetical protein
MLKDILIGGIDLYNWDKVKTWIKSARQSGFSGDIVLLGYRIANDILENSKNYGVDVYQINYDSFGNEIVHEGSGIPTQCHQLRFFHTWQFLVDNHEKYNNVIITDVRDVIFQKNPSEYLNEKLSTECPIMISSEGILFKDEPWNLQNLVRGFGPIIADKLTPRTAHNVGVLAGKSLAMKNLCLSLYSNTVGRYIPSDQSSFNVLLYEGLLSSYVDTNHNDSWACQCGVVLDPEKSHYTPFLLEPRPVIKNGLVYNNKGELFHIVHQWDRVPELKSSVERRYEI